MDRLIIQIEARVRNDTQQLRDELAADLRDAMKTAGVQLDAIEIRHGPQSMPVIHHDQALT